MTRILIRAVRAVTTWLLEPIHQDRRNQNMPLCIEAWLIRPATMSDRDYPPFKRTIPLNIAWMVQPC